jgi:hypothetical protein
VKTILEEVKNGILIFKNKKYAKFGLVFTQIWMARILCGRLVHQGVEFDSSLMSCLFRQIKLQKLNRGSRREGVPRAFLLTRLEAETHTKPVSRVTVLLVLDTNRFGIIIVAPESLCAWEEDAVNRSCMQHGNGS